MTRDSAATGSDALTVEGRPGRETPVRAAAAPATMPTQEALDIFRLSAWLALAIGWTKAVAVGLTALLRALF